MSINKITVDLSFARAARLIADRGGDVRFFLVGCGGTGGWLAQSIARLSCHLISQGRNVGTVFIDHDRVGPENIPRQNFCHAEIGIHKAVALARRFTAAWNVPIKAVTEKYDPEMLDEDWGFGMRARRVDALTIAIGCVDNARARRLLAQSLYNNLSFSDHHLFWLDCGNSKESGQVLLGSAPDAEYLKGAFTSAKVCKALPSPALQVPGLLKEKAEEKANNKLTCAEAMALNMQGLMVNQECADRAGDYLLRLTTGRPLRRFATYFDQETGKSESYYITPEEIAGIIKMPVDHVMAIKTMKASEFVEGRRRRRA